MEGKFIKRIGYYFKIWFLMSKNSFMVMLSQKLVLFIFLFGKIFRFGFFILFIYFLITKTTNLAGYNVNQVIFFFLTFNIVDVFGQFLFREVYRFRPLLISGDFDLILEKPFNPLFRVLMGGADIIDLVTIPPLVFATIWVGNLLNPSLLQVIIYIVLVINGLLISSAFHIAVISLGIITLEIDHTIMIFRDMLNMGKFPVDIYPNPLKGILTYLIPVGLMISIPASSLMGIVSAKGIGIALLLGVVSLVLAIKFWNFALKSYTSASS